MRADFRSSVMRGRAVGLHPYRQNERARQAFVEFRGEQEAAQREREILGLPTVEWKGRTLYTIICNGEFGNGPHLVNVPEALLWALCDVRHYRCPYHS